MASLSSSSRPLSSHKLERPPVSSSNASAGTSSRSSVVSLTANEGQRHGQGQGQQTVHSVRSRVPFSSSSSAPRRSVAPSSRHRSPSPSPSNHYSDSDAARVRVAVRLRPRNAEDLSDADYPDCVEVQPELKKLKLRKNNWSAEYYRFDEVFAESASQKRVYEVVAKPVVESVLEGYNGTVMAYGQTGTGKTYTLGRLGKENVSERGIMVRALEDIIANTSPTHDSVEVSYLQLYMESIQDLLAPERTNIPIAEDGKSGEVSVPGATVIKIQNLDHFLELLKIGEANRHAANTNLNTESSRSHAILMVYLRRSAHELDESDISSKDIDGKMERPGNQIPIIRKSKLLLVDLAGSERLDKSGSEGHLVEEAKFINLSLTSLGKCIYALAENSSHIPTRDSKLTRLLRDSFGGSARTSLIITIGPSSRHHSETTSTVLFGQRAMKIINTVKLKEEFDYESLCRKLESQVEQLTAEVDKQQKLRENHKNEMEKKLTEQQNSFAYTENSLVSRSEFLEKENTRLESEMKDLLVELNRQKEDNNLMHDEITQLAMNLKNSKILEKENRRLEVELRNVLKDLNWQKENNELMRDDVARLEMTLKSSQQQQLENSTYQKVLVDTTQMYEKKIADLMKQSETNRTQAESAEGHLDAMKKKLSDLQLSMQKENSRYQKTLAETTQMYEEKITTLTQQLKEENSRLVDAEEQVNSARKILNDQQNTVKEENEMKELKLKSEEMHQLPETTVNQLQLLQIEKKLLNDELQAMRQALTMEEKRRKAAEYELATIKKAVPESEDGFEEKRSYTKENFPRGTSSFGQRSTIAKICEEAHANSTTSETVRRAQITLSFPIEMICQLSRLLLSVGLEKILSLLTSEDLDVQTHAVKVVANLAAEDSNQEKIVHEGGLDALLMLLQSAQNTTILRVASGAIANLAMNEMNQGVIASKGGARLLANTVAKTDDPQTLRMVAGAIANLCGNEKLHVTLREDGAIKALVAMARSGNLDVTAQVARGMANFAKCESRAILQGNRKGRSLLVEDNALTWLIANCNAVSSSSARRHIELAICHLAQNEDNANDFLSGGGLRELVRISAESSREDIRNLAKKTLNLNPSFRAEV